MLVFRHPQKNRRRKGHGRNQQQESRLALRLYRQQQAVQKLREKEDRSILNVPFVTGNAELDAKFVKEATEHGLCTLKGHKLVGGMRASIYNAMPVEGIKALVEFMAKFERENG